MLSSINMANIAFILFMVFTIILLFAAMVFSAMAATDANKGAQKCKKNCNKYSMWAALVTGLSVALIFISLIIYIYVSRKHITKYLESGHKLIFPSKISDLSMPESPGAKGWRPPGAREIGQ